MTTDEPLCCDCHKQPKVRHGRCLDCAREHERRLPSRDNAHRRQVDARLMAKPGHREIRKLRDRIRRLGVKRATPETIELYKSLHEELEQLKAQHGVRSKGKAAECLACKGR